MLAAYPEKWRINRYIERISVSVPGTQIFTDSNLFPYAFYSYQLETSNVHGSTRSAALTYRTQPGIPIGNLHLNPILPVGMRSASFNWTTLSNNSGPIEKYVLACRSSLDPKPCGQYEGLETSATVGNLVPFTKYSFDVQACTSAGCLLSDQVAVMTAQAPPEEQEPPVVQSVSSTELAVNWAPPKKANGKIQACYSILFSHQMERSSDHCLASLCCCDYYWVLLSIIYHYQSVCRRRFGLRKVALKKKKR